MKYKMAIAVLTVTLISALIIGCGNHQTRVSIENTASGSFASQESVSDRPTDQANTTYSIDEEFSNIDILTEVSDITVQKGTETQIEVHMPKQYRFEYEIENNTLYLTEKQDGPFWTHFISFHNISDSYIVVTLTEKQWETFKAKSDVGNVSIEDQNADNFTISSSTGEIELSNCQADILDADTDTGALHLNHVSGNVLSKTSTGKISIYDSNLTDVKAKSDTGSISVARSTADNIDLKTDTGKIDVEIGGEKNDYNYDLDFDTGHIKLAQDKYSSGTYQINNDASKNMTLHSDTGSCSIQFFQSEIQKGDK